MKINLSLLRELGGFTGACLVDSDTGLVLGIEGGGGIDLDLAAAGNTEVVRAKRATMAALKFSQNEKIEDILISLTRQYHLIRLLESNEAIFLYVVLDRKIANLALARIMMKRVEQQIDFA